MLGDRLWWYVCCGPGEPYNNFFVTMPALSHRVLFWQQKREKIEGLLYWETAWWNPANVKDPWTDMATVKEINRNLRGDGSLFYPGKQVGVDGPVSSQRLEMVRDGLEDFDYLTLANAFLGQAGHPGIRGPHRHGHDHLGARPAGVREVAASWATRWMPHKKRGSEASGAEISVRRKKGKVEKGKHMKEGWPGQ